MNRNLKQLARRRLKIEEFADDNHVAGRGDRQELGETLHKAEHHRMQEID